MSTKVHESCVIAAPCDKVWAAVRDLEFGWYSIVKSSKGDNGVVGGTRVISYADGTVQTVKVTGLDDTKMSVTWDLVESDPPAMYMSAMHTIHCRRITESNQTYLEWVSDYSMDSTQEVVQDSRFKHLDAFAELRKSLS
eukprot:TRINITY_DN1083_c0_g1_i1.p1 TRINITY_DN1083_c0_g1~~TRINITY_DN1083_c0_g1_i1.p1  ORF type:complete len:139 (+),score=27.41 TRINITY_DN1083_c0_g1_i1:84-500(+)